MAEKTDEEIINEVGLASTDISEEDALEELTIKDDEELEPVVENNDNANEENNSSTENVIKNEDKDDDKNDLSNEAQEDKKVEDEKEIPIQKKEPKIKKVLIGVIGILLLLITLGAILYFTGFFDPEPPKKVTKVVLEKKKEPEITFNEQDIDKTKLNKKLTMLTKKEIMNKDELEAEEKRIKEEERKKKEAEAKALAEKKKEEEAKVAAQFAKIEEEKKLLKEQQEKIKQEQEAFLKLQENATKEFEDKKNQLLSELSGKNFNTMNNQNATDENIQTNEMQQQEQPATVIENEMPVNENETMAQQNEPIETKNINLFLSFINVATIKGELYKSYLDKVMKFDKNISLCRDEKNRIEIYFGPYDSQNEREKVLNNLIENGFKESYLVDFTEEEYKKRCEY